MPETALDKFLEVLRSSHNPDKWSTHIEKRTIVTVSGEREGRGPCVEFVFNHHGNFERIKQPRDGVVPPVLSGDSELMAFTHLDPGGEQYQSLCHKLPESTYDRGEPYCDDDDEDDNDRRNFADREV